MKKYILSERVNLFEPNVYIQLLVQLKGPAAGSDADKLADAVKKAYMVNESTMSKIVLKENGDAYYEKIEKSGCKVMILDENFDDIIRENEKRPFRLEEGELMRVFVILQGSNLSLLLMAHHLAGDGKSMVYFLEDVMRIFVGQKVEYKPMKTVTGDFLSAKTKLPAKVRLYVNGVNRKWKKKGQSFTWEDYYHVHKKYWETYSSCFEYKIIFGEEFDTVKANAKRAGVSVNSYLVTTCLKERGKGRKNVLGIPVDVRENDSSMSNQVSGISVKYKYLENKTIEENAVNVHNKIYKKLGNPRMKYFVLRFISVLEPSLIDSVLLCTHGCYQNQVSGKLAGVMGYMDDKASDLGVTNLGKIGIPSEYGEYEIGRIMFFPPAVSYAKEIVGVVSTDSECVMTHRFSK